MSSHHSFALTDAHQYGKTKMWVVFVIIIISVLAVTLGAMWAKNGFRVGADVTPATDLSSSIPITAGMGVFVGPFGVAYYPGTTQTRAGETYTFAAAKGAFTVTTETATANYLVTKSAELAKTLTAPATSKKTINGAEAVIVEGAAADGLKRIYVLMASKTAGGTAIVAQNTTLSIADFKKDILNTLSIT